MADDNDGWEQLPTVTPGESQDVTWGDYGSAVSSGAKELGAGAAALVRRSTDDNPRPAAAFLNAASKYLQGALDQSSSEDVESMSPAGKARLQSSLTDPAFYEHPFSAVALKSANMTPMIGATVVGGLLAGPFGAAAVQGGVTAGDLTDQIYKQLDLPDDQLQKTVPYYASMRSMGLSEEEARKDLTDKAMGSKPLIAALAGAAAGLLGPGAIIGRGAVAGAAESSIAKRAVVGGAENAVAGAGLGAGSDALVQQSQVDTGQKQGIDENELIREALTGAALGAVQGGAAGAVFGHGAPEAKNDTTPSVSQPVTGRATAQPPKPPTTADVGNPDSAPTRSETKYPKKGAKTQKAAEGTTAQVVDAGQPNAEEAVALAAKQPEQTAEPVAKPAEPAAEPVTPEVTPPEQKAPERTAAAEPVPATPDEGKPVPGASEPGNVAEPASAPVAEPSPTPRVLEAQDPEAKANAAAQNAAVDKNLTEMNAEPEAKRSHKGKAVDDKKAQDATAAKSLFDDNTPDDLTMPGTAAARDQLKAKLESIVNQTKEADIKLPAKVGYDTTADHIVWLKDLHDTYKLLNNKRAWIGKRGEDSTVRLANFLADWKAAADGDFKQLRDRRRVEGDLKKRVSQGDVEEKAAAPAAGAVMEAEPSPEDQLVAKQEAEPSPEDQLVAKQEGEVERDIANEGRERQQVVVKNAVSTPKAPRQPVVLKSKREALKAAIAQKKTDSERISSAAVQVEGKTYTGKTHADAIESAAKELGTTTELATDRSSDTGGFVTNTGRYVDRKEAQAIAERGNQVNKRIAKTVHGLDSGDLKIGEVTTKGNEPAAQPTEAQKKAGNYPMEHKSVGGLPVSIETKKGETRSGTSPDGKKWSVKSPADYGYIKRTEGADGDHVDTYLGPHAGSDEVKNKPVLVIDQHDPNTGKFDEHKVMLGFDDAHHALDTYERGFSDGRGLERVGAMNEMTFDQFKDWLKRGDTTKPTNETVSSAMREPTDEQIRRVVGQLNDIQDKHNGTVETPDGRRVPVLHTETSGNVLKHMDPKNFGGYARSMGPMFHLLRKRLLELVPDVPVHFMSPEGMRDFAGNESHIQGSGAVYTLFDSGREHVTFNVAHLNDPNWTARAMLHELTHAATMRALEHSSDRHSLVEHLELLMGEVNHANPRARYEYGMTDHREFLAEAFTNPAFQKLLASIPLSKEGAARISLDDWKNTSVWSSVVDWVRRAFGLPEKTHSVLDAAIRIGDHAMEVNAAHKEKQGRTVSVSSGMGLADGVRDAINGSREKAASAVRQLTEHPVDAVTGTVRDIAMSSAATSVLKRLGNALSTNDQYRQRLTPDMEPHARKIFDMVEKQGVASQRMKKAGQRIIADAMSLMKKFPGQFDKWSKLVNEQTMFGVDASSPIGEGRNKYLELSKKNAALEAAGKLDPSDLPMSQWEAHAEHPRLASEFSSLDPSFHALQDRLFDYFSQAQHDMAHDHVTQFLRAGGVPEADLKTRADKVLSTSVSSDFREALNKEFGGEIANSILQAKKLAGKDGVYAPLMRHGDYAVGGTYKVAEPKNAVQKIGDNTWEFKTRKEAHDFAQGTGLHYDVDTAYYDPLTGKRTTQVGGISTAGTAEQRYQVHVQRGHLEFTDTAKEAEARQQQLHESGLLERKPYVEQKQAFFNSRANEITGSTLGTIIKKLKQTDEYQKASAAQQREMQKAVHDAAIVTLAGNRVQARRLPRRNVEGASDDFVRNLLTYTDSMSNYRAKVQYRPQIEEAIKDMQQHVSGMRYDAAGELNAGGLKRSEAANEIENRARAQNPDDYTGAYTAWSRRLSAWSYVDRMARPSHLILHQTHLPMITAPHIAGRHGVASTYAMMLKTWKQMTKAYSAGASDFVNSIADTLHEGTDYDALAKQNFKGAPDAARLGKMFDEFADIGLLHPQSGLEVQKYAQHRQLGGPLGVLDGAINKMDTVFRHATNATEAINRYVGATMAYRLEYAKLMKEGRSSDAAHAGAVEYARTVIANTQGFYSHTNAAPLFRNKWLQPFLQFRQFPQMMYHLLIKSAAQAFKGATWQEKVQGAASLAGVLGAHTLMTGLLGGLPLEAGKIAGMVTKGLGITQGDWTDFERWQYEQAVKAFGKDNAEYIMHGVSRQLFGADFHHRLGLNSFLTFGMPEQLNATNVWGFVGQAAAGAPGGLAADTLRGISSMVGGDIAGGAVQAFPLQALRDVYRVWNGGSTTPEGYKYKSAGEVAARALGFTPAGEAEYYEHRSEAYNIKQEYTTGRYNWEKKWAAAPPSERYKMLGQIQEWNSQYPPNARITVSQLNQYAQTKRNEELTGKRFMGVNLDKRTQFIKERQTALYGQQ
jgi:Inorganic Pyrophosphatase